MAFSMWYSEKDKAKDQKYIENIKKLEDMVSDLQQRLNLYEKSIDDMNNHLSRTEEKGVMKSNQITDLYERLKGFYEKEEVHTNKILQLETELSDSKEEIKAYRQKVEVLEQKMEELQKSKQSTKVGGRQKKKSRMQVANSNQFFQQNGGSLPDYVVQKGKSVKTNKNSRNWQGANSRLVSASEFVNKFYPKGQAPTHIKTFNPLKYS